MTETVVIENIYAVPPAKLWELAIDLDANRRATRGFVSMGSPGGHMYKGQHLDLRVSPLGIIPPFDWQIDVLECDWQARVLRTREQGPLLQALDVTLTVEPAPQGARLHERLEINAGRLTGVAARILEQIYRSRYTPRRKMLGLT